MTIRTKKATLSQIANQILNWVNTHKDYECDNVALSSNGTMILRYIDENGREKEFAIYRDFQVPSTLDDDFRLQYGREPRNIRELSFKHYRGHSTKAPKKGIKTLENSVKNMF